MLIFNVAQDKGAVMIECKDCRSVSILIGGLVTLR